MAIKHINEINIQEYETNFSKFEKNSHHLVQQTPQWITAYAENYIYQNKIGATPLQILFFEEGDNSKGVILLQKKTKRIAPFIYKKNLEIFGRGPTDFFQILIEKDYESQAFSQLSNWLYSNRHGWDELTLSEIPAPSTNIPLLIESLQKKGFKASSNTSSGFFFVDTTSDWGSFYNNFFKTNNKDLLKDLRKIERNGIQLKLESHRNDIYRKLEDVLHLYAQRRNTLGQKNTYETEERRGFVKEITEAYEKKGWVELSFLKDQENNIWAFQLDWLYQGVRYHWNHAYNEDFKKYSPGKIILFKLMKRSFGNPQEIQCNHMRGLAGYKNKLANQQCPLITLRVENSYSIRNKTIKLYQKGAFIKSFLKGILIRK